MNYIIYSVTCTPCKYRAALNRIKSFINVHGGSLEIKNTAFSFANREEAQNIGQPLPFIYNSVTDKATQLQGVTDEDLARIGSIS